MQPTRIALCSLLLISVVPSSFAIQSGDSLSTIRKEQREAQKAQQPLPSKKVEGSISCKMAAENLGQPCQLKITEDQTGKTYELLNGDAAMQLLVERWREPENDGTLLVVVEGQPLGEDVIRVNQVAKARSL